MRKRSLPSKISRLAKVVYLKLFRINDSPLKIALGFGLGVFVGVMPGIGPVIALLLAFLFRVNRASALLGSILFNTWVGLIALLLAIKIGSVVTGLNYSDVYDGWNGLIKNFKWEKLFEVSVYDVLIPIGIGYLIIAFIFAVVASVIVYMIAKQIKMKKIKSQMAVSAKK
ncbi:MAG: DUF2062 domain-containing protein [Candidatus Omnitrophota bacterium]